MTERVDAILKRRDYPDLIRSGTLQLSRFDFLFEPSQNGLLQEAPKGVVIFQFIRPFCLQWN